MPKELKSKISLQNFGKAMSQLDLSSVPKEKKLSAIMDHMMRIQADTVTDRYEASKIRIAQRMHHHRDHSKNKRIIVPESPLLSAILK